MTPVTPQENTFSNPPIKPYELEPIYLTKKEAWFKLGQNLLSLKFEKDGVKLYVIDSNDKIQDAYIVNNINCNHAVIKVNDIDICSEINTIISNYEHILKTFEITEKAKAIRMLDYKTAPNMPSEFEILVDSLVNKTLSSKIIKTFYVVNGAKTPTLGIYCYENFHYIECEDALKHEIVSLFSTSRLLDIKLLPTLVGIIVKKIEIKTRTLYTPAKGCILFKDKVFCWDRFMQSEELEKAIIDPSPDLIVMHRIPWSLKPEILKNAREGLLKYIPPKSESDLIELFKALAPKSYNAFLSWVKRPGEDEKDANQRVLLLLELIGYTLYPHDYPFHKAALLVGEGANGKSTFLKLVTTILSKVNVSGVNLTDLDPRVSRFAAAELYNKLANIAAEPARRSFDPTEFKKATGEDLMCFERKFRDPFCDYNYAKMIFAANELPEVDEDTYAYWRRWIVIEFPNRFKPDPTFFNRTFTQEEIETLIVLSIYAFKLVLLRGGFTEAGIEDVREEWLSRSNPVYRVVKRMVEDSIIEFSDGYVIKKDLYELYKRYALKLSEEGEDVTPLAQKDFTIHLTRYFPVRVGDKRVLGKVKHVYLGVKIKDYDKALELVGDLETPRGLF